MGPATDYKRGDTSPVALPSLIALQFAESVFSFMDGGLKMLCLSAFYTKISTKIFGETRDSTRRIFFPLAPRGGFAGMLYGKRGWNALEL